MSKIREEKLCVQIYVQEVLSSVAMTTAREIHAAVDFDSVYIQNIYIPLQVRIKSAHLDIDFQQKCINEALD